MKSLVTNEAKACSPLSWTASISLCIPGKEREGGKRGIAFYDIKLTSTYRVSVNILQKALGGTQDLVSRDDEPKDKTSQARWREAQQEEKQLDEWAWGLEGAIGGVKAASKTPDGASEGWPRVGASNRFDSGAHSSLLATLRLAFIALAMMVSTRMFLGGVVQFSRDRRLADTLMQQVRRCAACLS